jgi:TetR/AcrR family transcriptional repressor of nem operon
MKVTRAQADENRDRIIEVAARLFREHGFDGIGITDLMKGAGLTHGGFYGNFKSKEDLEAQACERALETSRRRWAEAAESSRENPLSRIIRFYVSKRHRDEPGTGCPLVALAPDAARSSAAVRSAFTLGIRSYVDILTSIVAGPSSAARRQRALSSLSEMVGAVILARASQDAKLSDEILHATKSNLSGLLV